MVVYILGALPIISCWSIPIQDHQSPYPYLNSITLPLYGQLPLRPLVAGALNANPCEWMGLRYSVPPSVEIGYDTRVILVCFFFNIYKSEEYLDEWSPCTLTRLLPALVWLECSQTWIVYVKAHLLVSNTRSLISSKGRVTSGNVWATVTALLLYGWCWWVLWPH